MNKKIFSYILLLIMFFGCSILRVNLKNDSPVGKYNYHQAGLYSANLEIKSDNTFVYEKVEAELRSVCKGEWEIISENELLLNGKDTRVYQNAIDSSFFPPFNFINEKVIFLGRNKIKHDNVILKKTQE